MLKKSIYLSLLLGISPLVASDSGFSRFEDGMDTIEIGGIGAGGNLKHAHWIQSSGTTFVINNDSTVNPHMMADVTSGPVFSESQQEIVKQKGNITNIKYGHTFGSIDSLKKSAPQLIDILKEGGKFIWSSYWTGLEREVSFLDSSTLREDSLYVFMGAGPQRSIGYPDKELLEKETKLKKGVKDSWVYYIPLEELKEKIQNEKKESSYLKRVVEVKEEILAVRAELYKLWFVDPNAQKLVLRKDNYDPTVIKGLDTLLKERVGNNPKRQKDISTHVFEDIPIKPFNDDKDYFSSNVVLKGIQDYFANTLNLKDIRFFIEVCYQEGSSAKFGTSLGDRNLYALRVEGTK